MPELLSPEKALARLQTGNARWAHGDCTGPRRGLERVAEAAMGQYPFATVLTCADSRVPAELVFDQGVGDLFVVRTAGHVVDDAVRGTLGYGAHVLRTPLVVVLGHTSCGAVTAAYERLDVHADVAPVVTRIGATALAAPSLEAAISAHVDSTVHYLRPRVQSVQVVGAVYDLATGHVRWI